MNSNINTMEDIIEIYINLKKKEKIKISKIMFLENMKKKMTNL